jgi:hypothetical protein
MGLGFYLLLHLVAVLVCVYWARAKGHSVLLLGVLACVVGPLLLLALPFVKGVPSPPAPVVLPPQATDVSFSAAAGPLGGYAAPGQAPESAGQERESVYTPFILNGIGVLLLVALGASSDDELWVLLVGVPLLSLVNGVFFLRAFAKRANGLAFLYLLVAVGGLSLALYVVTSIGHR